jgi:hypothetical protein
MSRSISIGEDLILILIIKPPPEEDNIIFLSSIIYYFYESVDITTPFVSPSVERSFNTRCIIL